MPTSQTTVGMVSGITEDVLWNFVYSGNNRYRIESVDYEGYYLAANTGGSLYLTNSQSGTETYWFVIADGDGYNIINQSSNVYLYASGSTGTLTVGLDLPGSSQIAQRVWTFVEYEAPEVVTFRNTDKNLYLKNSTGKNYNGESIIVGSTIDYTYDQFGFRVVYDDTVAAYKLMPISSCNGYYRALTAKSTAASATFELYDNSVSSSRQYFNLELQYDGAYVIALNSNSNLVLTCNDSSVFLDVRTSGLTNQKWELELYQYTSPQSVDSSTSGNYIDVELYYRSLEWKSPFGEDDTLRNVVSDFGYRHIEKEGVFVDESHEGVDLSANKNTALYAPCSGYVAFIRDSNVSGSGRYVIIETDYYEYGKNEENGGRKIYIIYMHLQSVSSLQLGAKVTTDTLLGYSGASGNGSDNGYDPHLHYGVFLAVAELREIFGEKAIYQYWRKDNANKTSINPMLFYDVNGCAIVDEKNT